jgi:hypothetical protein
MKNYDWELLIRTTAIIFSFIVLVIISVYVIVNYTSIFIK